MASLFMDPAACGPVNDLKQLGGRLDVDARARRDGFTSNNQHVAAGSQPFQALPQSSGFRISSPSSSSSRTQQQQPQAQSRPLPSLHRHGLSSPSIGQNPYPPFPFPNVGSDNAPPRASSSSSTPVSGSSGWAGSFHQSLAQSQAQSQAQVQARVQYGHSQPGLQNVRSNGWADEHLSQSRPQGLRLDRERDRAMVQGQGRDTEHRPLGGMQQFQFQQHQQYQQQQQYQGGPYQPVGVGIQQRGFEQTYHHQTHSEFGADLQSTSPFPPPPAQSVIHTQTQTNGTGVQPEQEPEQEQEQDLSGLRETARQILLDLKVRGEVGSSSLSQDQSQDRDRLTTEEERDMDMDMDMDMDNPFGSSEFFKLMRELALDPEEIQQQKDRAERDGDEEGGRERNVDIEGRGACFFGGVEDEDEQEEVQAEMGRGGYDAYAAELDRQAEMELESREKLESRWDGPSFNSNSNLDLDLNLDRAIPTVHQPVFDEEGRWVPYHKIKEFREKGMDVPRHLREALDLARLRDPVPGRARGQEQEEEEREPGDVNGFDNDGLLEFYGTPRRTFKRDPFAQDTRSREHTERSLTGGYTSRETDEAFQESEDALERVLGDEKVEQARRDGYYTERRRGENVGLDYKYLFVSENPYVQSEQRQKMGRVEEAVAGMEMQYQNLLEHEARVLEDPASSRAWFDLAIKQQELERDDQAIRALLQCISLDPECKEAYLALSVSYTNEGMIREGHSVLERWVDGASDSGLAKNKGDDADLGRFEVGAPGVHKNQRHEVLTRELMRMARMMPEGDIDADVQVALGVLFNASEEYEKAQDCFRAALFARQDDWMLYNRLGATLANGGKSEEALQYYEQALNLNPGYVRAMFNVGISLIKLARYRQAARYILDAIRLQHADASSNVKSIKSVTSDILWNTLGTTCMHLERHDLMDACTARDLDMLDQEFQDYEEISAAIAISG